MALARPAIRLARSNGADASTRSRLGGDPLLPPGTPWPVWNGTPLDLLALIDLAEMAPLDDSGLLPAAGLLNFFYEPEQQAWGFSPDHAGGWRVVHTVAEQAVETPGPPQAVTFEPHPLTATATLTIPGWEEPVLADLSPDEVDQLGTVDDAWREVIGLSGEWPEGDPNHQLGGWPDLVQGPLWQQAQLASSGIDVGDPRGYHDPRAVRLSEGAGAWRLLLQLDTDDDLGWMWGDVGRLYYTIRNDDLATGDFGRCWMQLQCG